MGEKVATEGNEQDRLVPITVRFTEGAMSVIDELAKSHGMTKAEIVRLVVDNRLEAYLSNVIYVEHDDVVQMRKDIASVYDELQAIRTELHRIGVNYNQDVKLRQIEAKYANKINSRVYSTYDRAKAKVERDKELREVQESSGTLNKEELESIMDRYDKVAQKVGETLCHIQG